VSRNEDITTGIWVDLMVLTNPDAKLLYIWSWTNEHAGMAGLYKIHEAMISVETGLSGRRLASALTEVAEHEFTFYEGGVMLVRTRVKRLRTRSPQIAKSIAKDLQRIDAEHPLRKRFLSLYGDEAWLREALQNVKANEHGGLREPHPSLTRTSPEPQPSLLQEAPGRGEGFNSSSKEDLSGTQPQNHARAELPAGFPEELRPHLRIVYRVLRDLAERHHANAVSVPSLAAAVMARPHKQIVRAVYDFAGWADEQPTPRRNVVTGYRNWIDKTHDLAGFEELDAAGLPAQSTTFARAGQGRGHRKGGPSDMAARLGLLKDVKPTSDSTIVDATCEEES
jgi:hypothetical protein